MPPRKRGKSSDDPSEPAAPTQGRKAAKTDKETTKDGGPSLKSLILWSFVAAVVGVVGAQVFSIYMRNRVSTPFDPTKPLRLPFSPRKWGSLRSGVYFGTKTMSPESFVTGLMWFQNDVVDNNIPIRHWCNQHDKLVSYSWTKHDFDSFGVQEIVDGNVKLITKFAVEGDNSWTANIEVLPRDMGKPTKVHPMSLVYYVATEAKNDKLSVPLEREDVKEDAFYVEGLSGAYPEYNIAIKVNNFSQNVLFKGYLSKISDPPLVQLKETLLKNLFLMNHGRERLIVVRGEPVENPNFVAHQVVFVPPISLSVQFTPRSLAAGAEDRDDFESVLEEKIAHYDEYFEKIFHLKAKGYNEKEVAIAQRLLSNMIGSIGHFYGSSVVQSIWTPEPVPYGPLQLLTAVPSRSFFPRGFLWDEGFHNLLISRFKPELSVEIVRSWFNLMNIEGWIPREVILGGEAADRVPKEFVVQRNSNANPPTLFLTLESLTQRNAFHPDKLRELFPRLEAWYNWFNQSQTGELVGSYRWRGRDAKATNELNPKTLTSGLDDYPRATHPTSTEIHLDLRCWMALASRVMAKIAKIIGDIPSTPYEQTAAFLSDNRALDQLHWSDEHNMYCDKGLHSLDVKLVTPKSEEPGVVLPKTRVDVTPPVYQCVPEQGYISLFPLILQILEPSNTKLGLVLDGLRDPNHLWSPFGLRSLSKNSHYYAKYNTEHDPPYWRGAIWININYLTLKSLHYYSGQDGPFKQKAASVYTELRKNIISNVINQYDRSGYIWEQYDDTTGSGKGSHPFTGWSALVVLIMAEEY